MPILGALLTSAFGSLFGYLTAYFTRKVAFTVAAVASFTAFTTALFVLFRSTLATLDSLGSLPAFLLMVAQISVPPVAPACISAYLTLWSACAVYSWQRELLRLSAAA